MRSHTDHILSSDTQATLLLCGRFSNDGNQPVKPLSPSEYNDFTAAIRREGLHLGDILKREGTEQIPAGKLDPERLHALLGRGIEMGFAVEEWARQGIWVLSREDETYPEALKSRLGNLAPPLLFGVGDQELLNRGGLGIVGSRDADEDALHFTREIAERCARERLPVISGGARGVDSEAMHAALSAGGVVVGILPEGVAKTSVTRANRLPISEGSLTLVSPYHPEARWTTGNAMGRNKYIYALSDWTVVVSSATDGGTWGGATENLKKGWVPLFVRPSETPDGNKKLIQQGGIPLELETVLQADSLSGVLNSLKPPARESAPTLFSVLENGRPS